MSPKVSIIIPCYNQAAYLPKAIASLQSQTLAYWECIVVDDGSTDNTAEIVANAALRDNRFRLIQKLNGGSASARNTGLEQATGKFIQFLDADDTIAPEKLEKQVALLEQTEADMSYTAYRFVSAEGNESKLHSPRLNKYTLLTGWGLGYSIPQHAFLYRTSFLKKNHLLYDRQCPYREDWNFLIACFEAKPNIVTLPAYCGAFYFQNETGKTGSYIKMQEGNFIFMDYKASKLKGGNKILWTYRISEELWIWLLRMMKYRSTASAKTIAPLLSHVALMIIAILLMPLSALSVLCYFVKTYLTR